MSSSPRKGVHDVQQAAPQSKHKVGYIDLSPDEQILGGKSHLYDSPGCPENTKTNIPGHNPQIHITVK